MADKNADKQADKPISAKAALLADAVFGLFGHKVGDKVLDHLGDLLTHTVHGGDKDHPKHLVSFGEAFTKLRTVDPLAYDIIDDFMRDNLTDTTDRNDFQVRSAKMGGDDVDVTVEFLRLVAAEQDKTARGNHHAARRELLDTLGLIGERAIDPMERAKKLAKAGWVNITTAVKAINVSVPGAAIKAIIETRLKALETVTTPAEAERVTEEWKTDAQRRLDAYKAKTGR